MFARYNVNYLAYQIPEGLVKSADMLNCAESEEEIRWVVDDI